MKVFIETIVEEDKQKHIYIESDDMQFAVRTYSDKLDKKGKPIVMDTKYFTTLQGCCKYCLQQKAKQETVADLKELIARINGITVWIEEKVGAVTK